jgi:hypothetical protein
VTESFRPGERRRLDFSASGARASVAPAPAGQKAPARDYTWPIIAYGVGAAGLAVGSIFGIATFNKESDLDEQCPGKVCPAEIQPDKDAADRYALIANIGFGVGIAGAGWEPFCFSARAVKSKTRRRRKQVPRSSFGLGFCPLRPVSVARSEGAFRDLAKAVEGGQAHLSRHDLEERRVLEPAHVGW